VAEDVNGNIQSIAQVVQEVGEATDSTVEGEGNVAKVVSDLAEMVGRFKYATGHAVALAKARTAHLAWKTRLRSFLDGKAALSEAEAVSHHDCAFGRWYYGEGSKALGDFDEMRRIEEPHAELHRVIKEVIKHRNAGENQQAEQGLARVGELSEQVVRLLDQIKVKAA
jgi:methyl-accepting chemotaxis protein